MENKTPGTDEIELPDNGSNLSLMSNFENKDLQVHYQPL